jgi:beta-galactosidase
MAHTPPRTMLRKLAVFFGLFSLAAIAFIYIGSIGQLRATAICPTAQISSSALLTEVPTNSQREQVYLNGIWDFMPAVGEAAQQPPPQGWGKIRVPGDWQKEKDALVPGVVERGNNQAWQDFDGKGLLKAWYRQKIEIPASWQGRAIVVNLDRVSTDAKLYVNGNECGAVDWPEGAVDISHFARAGEEITLDILVAAVADEGDTLNVMSPNEIYVSEGDNQLDSKGLIGEVRLLSYPQGAHINDVFVQPSVRQQQLKLDVEVMGIQKAGNAAITATLFDEKGRVEKEFTASARLTRKPTQTLQLSWNWPNPRLWDVGQPNLYTLRLGLQGEGIVDEYDQSFGFREFWLEGRKFYLNGTEIRLRPILHEDNWQGWGVGIPEVIDSTIEGYLRTGYNIAELWPWNYYERGRWHFRNIFAERAALKGFPVIAPALDAVRDGYVKEWNSANGKAAWEAKLKKQLRRDRRFPAILMWANSPNFFGHSDDQNPRRIGMSEFAGGLKDIENQRMQDIIPIGEDIIATIKQYDPTRPAMMHQGAAVGDVYALNSYLNLLPLQEREEWLSHWAENGEMPYLVVEFGTPLHASVMRGRNGFGQVIHSEPLMTEYSAIYEGKQAYALESSAYRRQIAEKFQENQQYENWHNQPDLDFAPAFQKLQDLFITNTWRSWRTYGMTGGMIPWSRGHGWQETPEGRKWVNVADYAKGNRGPFPEKTYQYFFDYLAPSHYTLHPAAKALLANNAPTLAWIAGGKDAFVAKDHNYTTGETLQKQAVLINDTRASQDYELTWQVQVKGSVIASEEESGEIGVSKTLFFPIEATLPDVEAKTEGEIILNARIGSVRHQDSFPFRIFTPLPANVTTVRVFDPVGKTTSMLQQLGYDVDSSADTQDALLIIGREALSSNAKLPINLERYVRNGGRVLIETQNPSWLQQHWGLRVAQAMSRRVFPINPQHPVVKGLDATDLRDWRGESSLIEAYPNTMANPTKRSEYGTPWYGWHWGNRGTVSSAAIEKPHLSGWRPILETEFDLAYSPLLELNYGKGRVILNTLDLEDYALQDAAARQIAQQLIDYAATAPLSVVADKVVLWGEDTDAALLQELGVTYARANQLDTTADLMIIGSTTTPSDAALRQYLNGGGKVFFLPRQTANNPLGVTLQAKTNFSGSLKPPNWPETAGISVSDLRSRSNYNTWLVTSGGEVAADGLLSRVQVGDGTAIFAQLNPQDLNADTQTYLRLTRWRQYHAIAQILANLGASFQADKQALTFQTDVQFYHPDYRADFDLGDDPYRYYRW